MRHRSDLIRWSVSPSGAAGITHRMPRSGCGWGLTLRGFRFPDAARAAARDSARGLQEVHSHVKPRDVVADWKARLEQQSRPARLGHEVAIDQHLDVPRRVEYVDSM